MRPAVGRSGDHCRSFLAKPRGSATVRHRCPQTINRLSLSLSLSVYLINAAIFAASLTGLLRLSVSQSLSSSLRAPGKITLREVVRQTGPPRVRPPPCASREVLSVLLPRLSCPLRRSDSGGLSRRCVSALRFRGGSPTLDLYASAKVEYRK